MFNIDWNCWWPSTYLKSFESAGSASYVNLGLVDMVKVTLSALSFFKGDWFFWGLFCNVASRSEGTTPVVLRSISNDVLRRVAETTLNLD